MTAASDLYATRVDKLIKSNPGHWREKLSPTEAAAVLGATTEQLDEWRKTADGPRFSRDANFIKYRRVDLHMFAEHGGATS